MNKTLQNSIVVGITLVSFSLLWALVWTPYKHDRDFKRCLQTFEETLVRKQSEISSNIVDLEGQRETARQEAVTKLEVFLKENPVPKIPQEVDCSENNKSLSEVIYCKNGGETLWTLWKKNYESIWNGVDAFDSKIRNAQSDFEKVEKEKAESDEVCSKKFK